MNTQSSNEEIERLVDKSIEAFTLAIEIYNKPTIKYRVEGFSFFICNAWELLLKSNLINTKGYESIFFSDEPSRTISLSDCIKKTFTNNKDPLRINLEKILELRNDITHYVTKEYEVIYMPLFQSCVFNYQEKLNEFFGFEITKIIQHNFLNLVAAVQDIDPSLIKATYSKETAHHLLSKYEDIKKLSNEQNSRFSININHNHYITKDQNEADLYLRIAKEGEIPVAIIKEVKDISKTHPYSTSIVIDKVNEKIKKEVHNFCYIDSIENKRTRFTSGDFRLFVKYYDLKVNERYTAIHIVGDNKQYSYSLQLIEFIINEIKKNPEGIIQSLKNLIKKS